MYNGRKHSGKKKGVQPGQGLSKAKVEKKVQEGVFAHRLEEVGIPRRTYVTRYRLDLEVKEVATEIRIYADEMAAFLYSEGVVANERICEFINSISGDLLNLSECSAYGLYGER